MVYPVIDMLMTGQRIKYLCKKRNISVKDLQKYMGFACPQTIYRWFGGTALPNLDNLFALSELIGISMNGMIVVRAMNIIWELVDPNNILPVYENRRMLEYVKYSKLLGAA